MTTMYTQPPGWARQEAINQLGWEAEEPTDELIVERAWQIARSEEDDVDL
jgi:hypothetical protein